MAASFAIRQSETILARSVSHPLPQHVAQKYGYLARPMLKLPRFQRRLAGAGVFLKFCGDLRLTAPGKSRSVWQLPRCFAPTKSRSIFTYHHDVARWTVGSQHCHLQTVAKGQEFVIDPTGCPGVMAWIRRLFTNAA
jgi:putative DNA base modification enzyme with NMAD domain